MVLIEISEGEILSSDRGVAYAVPVTEVKGCQDFDISYNLNFKRTPKHREQYQGEKYMLIFRRSHGSRGKSISDVSACKS